LITSILSKFLFLNLSLPKPLKETIDDDFATFDFNNNKIGVAQLEIVDVDKFIKKNVSSINKVLEELKKRKIT